MIDWHYDLVAWWRKDYRTAKEPASSAEPPGNGRPMTPSGMAYALKTRIEALVKQIKVKESKAYTPEEKGEVKSLKLALAEAENRLTKIPA